MPRRTRTNIGRNTRHSRNVRLGRKSRTAEERSKDNEISKNRMAKLRRGESQEKRNQRLQSDIIRHKQLRQTATKQRKQKHLKIQFERILAQSSFHHLKLEYNPDIKTSSQSKIDIGEIDKEEWTSGKVLPTSNPPPAPLQIFISSDNADSKLFMKKNRKSNSGKLGKVSKSQDNEEMLLESKDSPEKL